MNRICDHPAIKAISFVGGDKAGSHIYHRYIPLMNTLTSAGLQTANESKQI